MNFSKKIITGLLLLSVCTQLNPLFSANQERQYIKNQTDFNSKRGEERFLKGQELFFSELYSQALIEFQEAMRNTKDQTKLDQLEFYQAICNSFMLNESSIVYLESFLDRRVSYTYDNIIQSILGEAYLKKNNISKAIAAFQQVDSKALSKTMTQRYNFYYGKALFESDKYKEAKFRLSQVSGKSNPYAEDVLYFLSYIKYQDKDYSGALDGFAKLSSNSKYSQSQIFIAQIKFQSGDFKYIIDNKNSLEKSTKGDDLNELYRLVGESYYNLEEYASAINYIEKHIKSGVTPSAEQYYMLGYSYYMNNMYKEAIDNFTKIINGSSDMAQNAYYHLADSYLKTDDRNGALRAFSMAASMDYNKDITHDALYNHVKLSYEMGGGDIYAQIIELMQRFLNKYPQSPHTNEIKGYLLSVYINTSDYQNAITAIKTVKNPSSQIIEALQRMCYLSAIDLYKNGKFPEAVTLFKESVKYDASFKYNSLSKFWQAESMIRMGKYDKDAENLYRAYIQATTKDVKEHKLAHYNIAYIRFNNKDWAYAADWFNKFLNIYPTEDQYRTDAYSRIGDIHFGNKEYKKAIDIYSKAVSVNSSQADYPQYQIAISRGLTGNTTGKIAKLKEIAENKNSVYSDMAIVELAATYNRENKFSDADKLLKDFVETQKESPYYLPGLLEIAVSNVNMGNNDKALNYYKRVVTESGASPESNDALIAIKSIYISKGDANPYFAFMKSVGKDSEVDNSEKEQITFDAITQHYLKDNRNDVIHSAASYKKEFPNGIHITDITYYLAESLFKTGDKKSAMTELERVIATPSNKYLESAINMAYNIYSESGDLKGQYKCAEMLYGMNLQEATRQKSLQTMMELALAIGENELINSSAKIVLADEKASKEALSYANYSVAKEAFDNNDYISAFTSLKKSSIPLTRIEGAHSEYMKAVILFNDKKYSDTEKLILNFAKKGTPHQYHLAKSFILLGDTYMARNDLFQAKATYQSIVDGYGVKSDGIIELAKTKISEIENKEKESKN